MVLVFYWPLLVGGLLLQGWWWGILQATTVPEGISLHEFEGQKLLLDKLGSALSSLLPLNPCSEQSDGQHLGPWQQTQEMKADITEATKMFCFLTLNGDSILPSLLLSKDTTSLSGVQKLSHCWWFIYLSCMIPQFHIPASRGIKALLSGHAWDRGTAIIPSFCMET